MANLMPGENDWMAGLQGLLGQFGPSEDEKRQAKMAAIAQFGLGLLGAPKGGEFQRLGLSGINAMNAQQEQLANLRAQKMQSMQGASQAMGVQEQMRKFADEDALRKAMTSYQTQNAAPAQGAPGAPGGMGATPSLSPPQGVAASAPQGGEYERLIGLAKYLESKGLPQQAMQYYAQAEKYAPQYDGTETAMKDGKAVLLQKYKNRAPSEMAYQPKPDYKQVDTGGGVQFIDPLLGMNGPSFNKTVTPDAMLSSDTTRRGQNMTDARSRDAQAFAQAQANKPQVVTGPNGEVFTVDARTSTGQEVKGPDGTTLNKGIRLTETQSNATAYGMRMKAANDIVSKLESTGYDTASPKNLLAANGVTNYVASPEAQSLYQAKLNFMTASLRKESGAAISKSEFETEDKKYFPQPGDSAKVREQKQQMRTVAMRAMAQQAGPGAAQFAAPSIDDLVKKYAK
jgi:hypothetical protein